MDGGAIYRLNLTCCFATTQPSRGTHWLVSLRENGYTVDEATDGDSAIVHLKSKPVDLILLDLNMPGSDGFDVLSYLQEHRRSLPVILLSGMAVNKIQHKMHGLPTPELPPLLIKPIDPQQLLGLLELQLSGGFSSPTATESAESSQSN